MSLANYLLLIILLIHSTSWTITSTMRGRSLCVDGEGVSVKRNHSRLSTCWSFIWGDTQGRNPISARSVLHLNGLLVVRFVGQKTQCPQIYIKLTHFEDNDSRKLPWKYYFLRCCSFCDKWVKQCHENNFSSRSWDENYFSMYERIFMTLFYSFLRNYSNSATNI